jgi:molybdopterin converting factor small subunit
MSVALAMSFRTREGLRAVTVISLRGPLKTYAGDCAEHRVDAGTVGEALRALEGVRPGVRGWILDERGHVRRHIALFVNGEYGSESTVVGPDDRIDVLPAISGGAD